MNQHELRFVRLKNEITHELDHLDALQSELCLIERADFDITSAKIRALASILHDFYTGYERIFERIAEEFEGGLPSGPNWHRLLLQDMAFDLVAVRPPVIGEETAKILQDYLAFRYRFRNVYGYELDYARIKPLLRDLPEVMELVKNELHRFLARQEEVLSDGRKP